MPVHRATAAVHRATAARHPEHDAVRQEVRSWFTTSYPEIGYEVVRLGGGWLSELGGGRARLILDVDDPEQVPAVVAEARDAAPGHLTIWVDDRERAEHLDSALQAAACSRSYATTHLALVGKLVAASGPEELDIREMGEDRLEEWCSVKLRAFGESEEAPAAAALAGELVVRRAEMPISRYVLGSVGDELAAVLSFYFGKDQLVFNLGTRLPFRHQGIAQALLARFVADAEAAGCRSAMINAEEGGQPAELYRRMGFVDEVYWYRRYELG